MSKETRRNAGWQKAIPRGRDRLQSQVLVWVIGVLLSGVLALQLGLLHARGLPVSFAAAAFAFSAGFALLVWTLRAATAPAAALGGVICADILLAPEAALGWQHTSLLPLLMLFLLTFAATRFGRRRKELLGTAEHRQGRRASQIVANLGIAGLCAAHASVALLVASIAALAEAAADTVSSEIGQATAGPTWMITTCRRVAPGADGGISLTGTLFGAAAAAAVVGVAATTGVVPAQLALVGFGAAVAGLVFDSVLGATVERRGWIGNDWVNFASTAFAALLAHALVLTFSQVNKN